MRIKPQEITKRLDGDDGPGHGTVFVHGFLEKNLQRLPATAAQIWGEFAVIEEMSAEDFVYAKDEM